MCNFKWKLSRVSESHNISIVTVPLTLHNLNYKVKYSFASQISLNKLGRWVFKKKNLHITTRQEYLSVHIITWHFLSLYLTCILSASDLVQQFSLWFQETIEEVLPYTDKPLWCKMFLCSDTYSRNSFYFKNTSSPGEIKCIIDNITQESSVNGPSIHPSIHLFCFSPSVCPVSIRPLVQPTFATFPDSRWFLLVPHSNIWPLLKYLPQIHRSHPVIV